MLVYNDQKDFAFRRNEETYSMFVPEDNFWRRLNKKIDFGPIYEKLKDNSDTIKEKSQIEIIRLFKCLLLKSYYELSDEEVISKIGTDLTFKYFLEYDPSEELKVDVSLLKKFGEEKPKGLDLIDTLNGITKELNLGRKNSLNNYNEEMTFGELASIFLYNIKEVI